MTWLWCFYILSYFVFSFLSFNFYCIFKFFKLINSTFGPWERALYYYYHHHHYIYHYVKKLPSLPEPANSWHQRSCMLWLFRLVRVDPGWLNQPVLKWILVGLTGRMTLSWEKGDPARRITLLAGPTFCFSCKQFATFVRKYRKSWLP